MENNKRLAKTRISALQEGIRCERCNNYFRRAKDFPIEDIAEMFDIQPKILAPDLCIDCKPGYEELVKRFNKDIILFLKSPVIKNQAAIL